MNTETTSLDMVLQPKGGRFKFEYDMGDSWIHDVWVKDARDYAKNEEPVIKLLQAIARQCHLRPQQLQGTRRHGSYHRPGCVHPQRQHHTNPHAFGPDEALHLLLHPHQARPCTILGHPARLRHLAASGVRHTRHV